MFKLIAVFSALCAVASAGYLGSGYGGLDHGYGLGYSGYGGYAGIAAPAIGYHAPLVHAAPVLKTYAAPTIVKSYAAPIVKTIAAPVATSYANTYKISTKAVPVVHAAPIAVHAAPALVAAPALHTSSSYHGSYGSYGLGGYGGYGGYGLGVNDYGYGHSLYH